MPEEPEETSHGEQDARLRPFPSDPDEARSLQESLAHRVRVTAVDPDSVSLVAGTDVTYSPDDQRLVAAVVVLSRRTLEVVDHATTVAEPRFPYVPGLFAFREAPPLMETIGKLRTSPDVVLCDGAGRAHPRRFGLACHMGWSLGRPTIGCAKSLLVGAAEPLAEERGSWSDLVAEGDVVGRALRTRTGVRPVYISVGHDADLAGSTRLVLDLSPRYRIPEPIRAADQLSREILRGDGDRSGNV
ncbi:endonuclease V [Haloactinospora alba]|uniref:Endonuclease V n=1 Tax=Haloactinospora alba TaxID=405555 RepID=A0A543NIX6_9ACTN|nr:endonuclease V [Haloactinospora alba]TQN31792.1 endonuclease V [Haloactinospora alba]